MRRATALLLSLGLFLPGAALAASPSPLTDGQLRAVHVLRSAPVFTDSTAQAASYVFPHALRSVINGARVKIAIMPENAADPGQSASDVAAVVLTAAATPNAVLFTLVGQELGAAAGSSSKLSNAQVQEIARTAFAAHQAGGFTAGNVEAALEQAVTQGKAALLSPPTPSAVSTSAAKKTSSKESSSDGPPVVVVILAALVVLAVVAWLAWGSIRPPVQAAAVVSAPRTKDWTGGPWPQEEPGD